MYQVTEKSTVFGAGTPFGKHVPFRYPTLSTKSLSVLLLDLALQLYPTGRAWIKMKYSIMEKLHSAINISYTRFLDDAKLTHDSCIPDNDNFDKFDCDLWEYRFGMITNPSLSVPTRRLAIFRRMARGRNVPARQHLLYLQYQLRLAGFDVYVFENGFIVDGALTYKRPNDISFVQPEDVQHGGSTQHGIGVQHGGVNHEVIANSYLPNEPYSVGDDYLSKTFFIGGITLGATAEVSELRQIEFRELVLKLKPAHLAAFTFINYV